MFCNQCGAKNYDDARYCSSCGNILVQPQHSTQIPPSTIAMTKSKAPSLWNPNAAANWSLLFSPAFGAYLHMKNWEALGETEKANSSRTWFFCSIVLSILGLGLIVLIAWYFSIGKKQCIYVKEKFKDRYPRKSWGKPLLIGFGIYIICILLVMLIPDNQKTQFQQKPVNQPIVAKADGFSFDPNTAKEDDDKRFDPSRAVLYQTEAQTTAPNKTQDTSNIDWDNGTIIPPKQEQRNPTQSELEKAHIDAILKAHPDAGAIVESQDFNNWVNNQSIEWKNYYKDVIDKGTSTQVIEMLDNYKKSINH